jgi:hypothetical protein
MATKTTYQSDQSFSDDIHWRLAMTQIYEPLGWSAVRMKPEQARLLDVSEGIDYVFLNDRGQITTVQERFREVKYQEYTDFTIRYRRDQSTKNDQHESEFYKIKADYFVYGIADGYKTVALSNGFVRFAVIDLKFIQTKIDSGQIQIRGDLRQKTCQIENNNLLCPINQNYDGSSSFFPIDIRLLAKLWGEAPILLQKGFY